MSRKLDPKEAEAVMLKAGYKPLEPYKTALTNWKCLHIPCGNIVYLRFNAVQQGNGGCNPCGRIKTIDAKRIPEKAAVAKMLKAGLKPLEPFILANEPWKCRCMKCKKVIYPSLTGVIGKGSGCGYCSGNMLDEEDAIKIMLKNKLQPLEPYKTALSKWKCKCLKCGIVCYPKYNSVQQRGGGCEPCGVLQRVKESRTPEKEAVAIIRKAKMLPLERYVSQQKPWKCKCLKCGVIITPRLGDIIRGGGCRNCSTYGISLEKPSYVYLITNTELNAHKVGMGNVKKYPDRLKSFLNRGWATHKVWQTVNGSEALKIESAVFRIIRKEMKLPIYLTAEDMPVTGGETETVDADSITLLQLERIINKVIRGMKR